MRNFYPSPVVFALTTLTLINVNAAERPMSKEAKGAWMTATPTEVDVAITYILRTEPYHHLMKNPDARMELATKLVEVADEQGVPPLFALSIIFRESNFDEKAIGKLGEIGLMQVGKWNVKRNNCDMSNTKGQITCGTRMLKDAFDICKTWGGALTRYATTTGQCTSDMPNVTGSVNIRLRDWQRLSMAVQKQLYKEEVIK